MHRNLTYGVWAVRLALAGCAILGLLAPKILAGEAAGRAAYEGEVHGLLERYCADCHTRDTSEGRWAFDGYANYGKLVGDQKAWGKVEQFVSNHIMPPHDAEAPSARERRMLLDWIDEAVFYVDPARPDPGPAPLRRLNRAEYNNTVRDVLGVESRPADQFPADDSGYGFDNIGDVLSISPLHLEKYLAAARLVAGEVTRLAPPPRVGIELTSDKLTRFAGRPEQRENAMLLTSPEDEVGTELHFPVQSFYRVLIRAAATRESEEHLAGIDVLCDGEPLAQLQTTAEWKGKPGPAATVFALVEIPAGEHRIGLRLANGDGDDADRRAAIAFLGVSGPFTPTPPQTSAYLRDALGERPLDAPVLRLSGEDLDAGSGRNSLDTGRAWFASNGYRHAPVLIREAGTHRVRFKVGAQQVGDDTVRFELRTAGETWGPFDVTAASQAEQWIETNVELPAGEHDWQVWFVNEHQDPQTGAERWFWLHEFTIEGPLEGEHGLTRDDATKLLIETGRRLFRRPLTGDESQKLERLVAAVLEAEQSPRVALRRGLEAILASPKFLFHPTPKPVGDAENGSALIDEGTLASRLSYFVWSSAPDEELLSLAERGELRSRLREQVKRMLRDPRSAALTENFAGQWLQLRNLEHAAPDPAAFPEFDSALAADMRRETELLFEYILRENRSVLEFLDADYTFLNARLAEHYRLPAPGEEGFQHVSLAGSPRRGVATHASILTITSHPTRTSPVNRGKWLLEQMLGDEPPPAPADVPPLPDTAEDENLPLRARLEQHRASPACASCHAVLDPPGFALENFDAVGRWRAEEAGRPVDASGRLITGEEFTDWSELQSLLMRERRDDFVRCLTEHLLTYALGRGLTFRDKLAVRSIAARCQEADYGFQEMILGVCESTPFQRMRTETP